MSRVYCLLSPSPEGSERSHSCPSTLRSRWARIRGGAWHASLLDERPFDPLTALRKRKLERAEAPRVNLEPWSRVTRC